MKKGVTQSITETRSLLSRRGFLRIGALACAAGPLKVRYAKSDNQAAAKARTSSDPEAIAASLEDNIYTRLLGVRPHLGAHEHISRLSGSRMSEEVMQAMAEANKFFVDMHELGAAAGRHIAKIMGAEDAIVTSGGFSAMILGAAACLTGADPEKIEALPQVTWSRKECLIQTGHRFDYEKAYRIAGMTIVEAKTREEFKRSMSERTAMVAALAVVEKQSVFTTPLPLKRSSHPPAEVMMPKELIEVGRKAGVPVLVDMASDLPPASNLTRFIQMGADLVVVSGGKAIGGPQSTGILAGRKDLIEAARIHNSPNENIGRGMKVGKEEIIGLIAALDRYIKIDHDAEIAGWNAKAKRLAHELQGIPGLTAEYAMNTMGYADVDLSWDKTIIPLTEEEARKKLAEGHPRVLYDEAVRTCQLRDGEDVLLARRLREFFKNAARKD
jgi:L-seryl-tRNA(Ser) seleniumtransferase